MIKMKIRDLKKRKVTSQSHSNSDSNSNSTANHQQLISLRTKVLEQTQDLLCLLDSRRQLVRAIQPLKTHSLTSFDVKREWDLFLQLKKSLDPKAPSLHDLKVLTLIMEELKTYPKFSENIHLSRLGKIRLKPEHQGINPVMLFVFYPELKDKLVACLKKSYTQLIL